MTHTTATNGNSEAWIETLSLKECLDSLRSHRVGRIAVDAEGAPIILPVNYRLVESSHGTWIALRTRPGNVIERAPIHVAFEIDELRAEAREGWSVLVRGTLHHVDSAAADFGAQFDPDPWIVEDRDAWLVIEPFAITGRRLHAPHVEWAFHISAYL